MSTPTIDEPNSTPAIAAAGIHKSYGDKVVLEAAV